MGNDTRADRHHGDTAVITGASRGIGRAVTLALAEDGANLVLAARSEDALETVAGDVRDRGGAALAVPTDVRDTDEVIQLVDQAYDRFDGIEILINNAGIYQEGQKPTWEIDPSEWAAVIDVNLSGMYRCARAVLRRGMLARGAGAIINMSSLFGKTGIANNTAYVVSKHGIQGLTNSLAKELRDTDIRVSSVCPGQVATSMTDTIAEVDRLEPADVVDAVRFILRQDANVYVPEVVLVPPDSIPLYSH